MRPYLSRLAEETLVQEGRTEELESRKKYRASSNEAQHSLSYAPNKRVLEKDIETTPQVGRSGRARGW